MLHEALRGAQQRLAKAEPDMRTTRMLMNDPDPPIDSVRFDTQQAVDRLLAALLHTTQQAPLPMSHDLHLLADRLPKRVALDIAVEMCDGLSYRGVGSQYSDCPGNYSTQIAEYLRNKVLAVEREVRVRLSEIEPQ